MRIFSGASPSSLVRGAGTRGYAVSNPKAEQDSTSAPISTPIAVKYPYFVNRVGVNQQSLPVYMDSRNAGSRSLTMIRKVDGDVSALCRDLFEAFGWGDPYDKKNPNSSMLVRASNVAGSQKLVVRGNWTRDIKAWLEERGF